MDTQMKIKEEPVDTYEEEFSPVKSPLIKPTNIKLEAKPENNDCETCGESLTRKVVPVMKQEKDLNQTSVPAYHGTSQQRIMKRSLSMESCRCPSSASMNDDQKPTVQKHRKSLFSMISYPRKNNYQPYRRHMYPYQSWQHTSQNKNYYQTDYSNYRQTNYSNYGQTDYSYYRYRDYARQNYKRKYSFSTKRKYSLDTNAMDKKERMEETKPDLILLKITSRLRNDVDSHMQRNDHPENINASSLEQSDQLENNNGRESSNIIESTNGGIPHTNPLIDDFNAFSNFEDDLINIAKNSDCHTMDNSTAQSPELNNQREISNIIDSRNGHIKDSIPLIDDFNAFSNFEDDLVDTNKNNNYHTVDNSIESFNEMNEAIAGDDQREITSEQFIITRDVSADDEPLESGNYPQKCLVLDEICEENAELEDEHVSEMDSGICLDIENNNSNLSDESESIAVPSGSISGHQDLPYNERLNNSNDSGKDQASSDDACSGECEVSFVDEVKRNSDLCILEYRKERKVCRQCFVHARKKKKQSIDDDIFIHERGAPVPVIDL